MLGRVRVDLGVGSPSSADFERALWNGAVFVENLGPIQLRRPVVRPSALSIVRYAPETSVLRTLNSSWPFFTSSPSRALISTTRPVGERDHRHRAHDVGLNHPVTFSAGAALYSPAIARGIARGGRP